MEEPKENELTPKKIFDFIKQKDNGNGADFNEIVENYKESNAEKLIQFLLKEGEVFEISPGKLKVLE